MSLPPPILESLAATPSAIERLFNLVPRDAWNWRPESWDGFPGEPLTAIEQVCHLRDIEHDGYRVRIRRMLEEDDPDLVSIDGDRLARERNYADADPAAVLAAFKAARMANVETLASLNSAQLERRGRFAEYGALSLSGLVHYLCSHDQQHVACMHWLLGKVASR